MIRRSAAEPWYVPGYVVLRDLLDLQVKNLGNGLCWIGEDEVPSGYYLVGREELGDWGWAMIAEQVWAIREDLA